MSNSKITLASNAIHNPKDPRHFMVIKPVARVVRIRLGDELLAESRDAVRLVEIGKDAYEPALYLPQIDIKAMLRQNDDRSHCPLKGDAIYFDLVDRDGNVRMPKIAWTYAEPFEFATELAGRVSFYTEELSIEEAPL